MAVSATTPRRARAAPTHVSVYIGLIFAIAGLLLAMYAYTGTRIYEKTFAYIALGGGALALIGILVAAWGRAVMAARAQRARRGFAPQREEAREEPREVQVRVEESPPTVAEPAQKKRTLALGLPKLGRGKDAARAEPADEAAPERTRADAGLFAFKRRGREAREAKAQQAVVVAEAAPVEPEVVASAPAAPALVRVTVRCPGCATEFTSEGTPPVAITCPSCGLSGTA